MLIGIDASRAVIAQRTGTEAYSLHVIRNLIRLDTEHRFRLYYNAPPSPGLIAHQAHCEQRVIPFPRLWTHFRLSAEMLLRPPDLLWVPSHVLPLIHPQPSVVTVHDLGHRYFPGAHTPRQRWYLEWSTRYHARAATHILADSRATMDDLVRIYGVPPARISIVHLGVDSDLRRVSDPVAIERVRHRYGISGPYILYLGTLQPRKNLTRLIEAFGEISQTAARSYQLVLAGKKGWMHEPIVRRTQELALEKRVVFPGFVEDADLPALYSGADLFVMPSLYEGFCLPVLEAMACEVPVVCSSLSSLPEVAGDAALSFDPRDVEGMAATIARGLDDAQLRAVLVARGRERVQQFTWERCAQRVLETLLQVATRATS